MAKCNTVPGAAALAILQQVGHVEFWDLAVGDLLLRAGALPQDPAGRRGEARGEGLPGGAVRPGGSHSPLSQMEAPEGCPAQVYTIMKDVSISGL
jgi:hypothetical protein